jgi:hypothetical protein
MPERDPYEGPYLESADLIHTAPVTVTIKDLIPPNSVKCANGKLIDKWIITFENATKQFICNRTNWRAIKSLHGVREHWPGKQITLGVRLTDAFGEHNVPCIRVLLPEEKRSAQVRKQYGKDQPRTEERE